MPTLIRAASAAMCLALAGLVPAQSPTRPMLNLKAVPFTDVRLKDSLWAPRQETNRKISLPHSLDMLEQAGNIKNLELAAKGEHTGFSGPVFMDSDTYKVLESVAFSLATHPDPVLEKRLDDVIAKIAAAQMPDGYLDTYYEVNDISKRWTNLRDNHEMYCAGHLIEAAVAHYQATGKKTLLNVATKLADHIDRTFGPGKRMGYPGHPELELALVKLWKVTGEKRYFDLANFFVSNRGSHWFATEHNTPLDRYDGTYWLDQVPIREQTTMVGHAVRAGYLMSGVTDVMAETHDPGLIAMIDRVWRNTTGKRMFVTGGIGASGSNEGFTTDYDLPNFTAYQETCASVAMAMWNQRLALLYGDSRYADVLETSLYNGVLAGGSIDGSKYFYVNPLASKGRHHRSGWFSCACCPPNEARTLASLGGYAYATSDDAIWVNLFIQGTMNARLGGQNIGMAVATDYPWDGRVKFTVEPDKAAPFALRLRVPGWSSGATVKVNGSSVAAATDHGYLVLNRTWRAGDVVDYDIPMPVRRIEANPHVREDAGRMALGRGPLIYCIEDADLKDHALGISLPAEAALTVRKEPGLLGGVVTINGTGFVRSSPDWKGGLYGNTASLKPAPIKAIPYYTWDNRTAGEMQVWIPTSPAPPVVGGPEMKAKVSLSFTSGYAQPSGVNDGSDPRSSTEQPAALCHFWPHKGTTEWVQYSWTEPQLLSSSRVYWFDDTGRGECRFPESWRLEYLDGATWKPVQNAGPYLVKGDQWCEVSFSPIKAKALRLVLQMKDGWAAGVRQWQVVPPDEGG